jgi:hypothetical protein
MLANKYCTRSLVLMDVEINRKMRSTFILNNIDIQEHMIQHHYVLYNHIITTGVKLTCRNYNLLIVIELLIKF